MYINNFVIGNPLFIVVCIVIRTIPQKATWERFSHNVQYPTKQNYFQNNGFAKRNPIPSFNFAFYKRRYARDQVFIWTYNDIAYETTFITE